MGLARPGPTDSRTASTIQGGMYRRRRSISSSRAGGEDVPEGPPLCISAKPHMNTVFTHFAKDRNCDVCKRTKATRASCRRNDESREDRIPRVENYGYFNSGLQSSPGRNRIAVATSMRSCGSSSVHSMDKELSIKDKDCA